MSTQQRITIIITLLVLSSPSFDLDWEFQVYAKGQILLWILLVDGFNIKNILRHINHMHNGSSENWRGCAQLSEGATISCLPLGL